MQKVLFVVMDGVGERADSFGNAVSAARTPHLDGLRQRGLFRTVFAHGTHVGLPTDSDIGNSEVGHNALGAGRVFDQGAKLVQKAIDTGTLFQGETWQSLVQQVINEKATLHLLGLLSDGNVHAHEDHLHAMLREAKRAGVGCVRIHTLLDGRDVAEKSAEVYCERLEKVMAELRGESFDVAVASGGGRMRVTMDRYEADWAMVKRGWQAHVQGEADDRFPSLGAAIAHYRQDPDLTDQYFPAFVIESGGEPIGPVQDGDAVIFFNFRGDRAIEICRAFTEKDFAAFERGRVPDVSFAGMMEYDGDLHIPPRYLVSPPEITGTLSEQLMQHNVRQFACSETQKFGHVTYFWNGNRSGYIDESLEEYLEIPSDNIDFDQAPQMKAREITDATVERLLADSFDFGRINYANGDMVGHTGNFAASVTAVEAVDLGVGRLIEACRQTDTILLVTADHGNCDEMFNAKAKDFPGWPDVSEPAPTPKTAHTLSEVPLYIFDPRGRALELTQPPTPGLANMANSVMSLLGLPPHPGFLPSLVKVPQ